MSPRKMERSTMRRAPMAGFCVPGVPTPDASPKEDGMNDFPIRLKTDDSPVAPDPQGTVIELAELLAAHVDELTLLRDLLTRWGTDPTSVCQRAQPRTVELHGQAGRIRDLVLELSRGYRAAGAFSSRYGRGA